MALLLLAIGSLVVAQPASAALRSVVTDPVGDAFVADLHIGGSGVFLSFQDIVKASITLRDGRFIFMMETAGPIPASPDLPLNIGLEEWRWFLDTDPATAPAGFPFAPGGATSSGHVSEFIVNVLWDGTSFTGSLIDRRPLLAGMDAIIIPVPFNIKGNEIAVTTDAGLVGSPMSFGWRSMTVDWLAPLGTWSQVPIDSAPDGGGGTGLATWPS